VISFPIHLYSNRHAHDDVMMCSAPAAVEFSLECPAACDMTTASKQSTSSQSPLNRG